MTQKEIEALAREYAYDCIPPEDWWEISEEGYERMIDDITEEQILPMFKWLSDRYEIVSKEKIKKEWKTAEWTGNKGGLYVLKMLFPQTLKSEEI